MVRVEEASEADLLAQAAELRRRYDDFKARGLSLDMTRGKPCPPQLDLSNALLTVVGAADSKAASGIDTRNYGGLEGLAEARQLFAAYFEVDAEEVLVGGNSSLAMMYNTIAQAMWRGVPGGQAPWSATPPAKFLCPVPGYDRHFTICESLGIEMINVAMRADGPDVDAIARLVSGDAAIKGIWCVPRYSNPTGVTYSDAVVEALAGMPTAATDFRVFWDDAYAVHHLTDSPQPLKNLLAACKAAGNPDRPYVFASTSKITFPGAGVAAMAASRANISDQLKGLFAQTIGPDKINQLRHVRFLRDMANIGEHMRRHAAILKPKFAVVLETLERELGGLGIAQWSTPHGGYFISLDTPPGCAARVVDLAGSAGVKLTQAGATYPYGRDPEDRNLRLAPTLPGLEEIATAMELVCVCVQIAAIDQQLHRD
jgi:aspartate/methionine/tyrosine aminotransferase